MQKIEVKITHPLLKAIPKYTTKGAAGIDLRACIYKPLLLPAGESVLISSGIAVNIANPNIAAVLLPRSGLGTKHGIVLGNLVGLIDSDYQGEVGVSVWNRSDTDFTINPLERICQMVFVPIIQVELKPVDEFSCVTARAAGGFGHTGLE